MRKIILTCLFITFGLCLNNKIGASCVSDIPSKSLTHSSRQLLINGWSKDKVVSCFGDSKHKIMSKFKKLTYGVPSKLPDYDEQWLYSTHMGHQYIFFFKGIAVFAIEEWSDF